MSDEALFKIVYHGGEDRNLEYKQSISWQVLVTKAKIAKSVMSMANLADGGFIVVSVKRIRFHDARHTHASIMLKQGIHPKIVQERLGHASIQITLDIYSHIGPGIQEVAARRFDEAFSLRHNDTVEEVAR